MITLVGRPLMSILPGPSSRSPRPPDAAGAEIGNDQWRIGAAAVVGLVVALVAPVLAVPVAVAVWTVPHLRARARRRRRDRDLVDDAPAVVELFRLAAAAGLSVHLAVGAVTARTQGLISEALADVVGREAMGEPLADALDRFGRLGSPVRPLAASLVAAERYGAPLGPALERVALDARLLRRRHTEEAARRLPVLLLFPLVVCILPAFGLLTVVPLVVASLPHLSS